MLIAFLHPNARAQARQPYLLWDQPAAITFPAPLSENQYRIRVLEGPPVAVPLTSSYNIMGITTDGMPYNNGGFDDSGWAWSAELLGRVVTWQGVSFPIGAPEVADAVTSATIPLVPGRFATLLVLGDLVNKQQPPTAQFVVQYTDGTLAKFQQSLSDWVLPRNYAGETLAKCMPTRHLLDGSTDFNSVCVYGYQLSLDPARTAASITMPKNRNVLFLSMVLLPPAVPGTLAVSPGEGVVLTPGGYDLSASFTPANPSQFQAISATRPLTVSAPAPLVVPGITWTDPKAVPFGTPLGPAQLDASAYAVQAPVMVPLDPFYRVNAMYLDGSRYLETGLDGTGAALSATQLGTRLSYAGASFPLGPAAVPDAASSSTIALPAGKYASLSLLGTAGTKAETNQPFVVTYTDGTTTTARLNVSSWRLPQHFAGETIVAQTTAAALPDGTQKAGLYAVYGYQFALNPLKTVQTLTLPANTDVLVFAAGLNTGVSFPVAGTFTYNPAAGTIPPVSTILSTHFVPDDTNNFLPADASVRLIVGFRDFLLTPVGDTTMTGYTGDDRSVSFHVAPMNGTYAADLSFSLSGLMPPLTTVTFSPATVLADGGEQTVLMTVHTRLLSGANQAPPFGRIITLTAAFCALLLLPQRRFRTPLRLCALALVLALLPVGCGTGYRDTVYPLTLTATDGTTQHSIPVTLHILASAQ